MVRSAVCSRQVQSSSHRYGLSVMMFFDDGRIRWKGHALCSHAQGEPGSELAAGVTASRFALEGFFVCGWGRRFLVGEHFRISSLDYYSLKLARMRRCPTLTRIECNVQKVWTVCRGRLPMMVHLLPHIQVEMAGQLSRSCGWLPRIPTLPLPSSSTPSHGFAQPALYRVGMKPRLEETGGMAGAARKGT